MTELWQAACWWNTARPRQLMWKWAQEDPAAQEAGEPRERPGERGDIGWQPLSLPRQRHHGGAAMALPHSDRGAAWGRPRSQRAHRASYQLFGKQRTQVTRQRPCIRARAGLQPVRRSDGHRLCPVGTGSTWSPGAWPRAAPPRCLRSACVPETQAVLVCLRFGHGRAWLPLRLCLLTGSCHELPPKTPQERSPPPTASGEPPQEAGLQPPGLDKV